MRDTDFGDINMNTITEDLVVDEIPQDFPENEESRKASTQPRRHQHPKYKGVIWEDNGKERPIEEELPCSVPEKRKAGARLSS